MDRGDEDGCIPFRGPLDRYLPGTIVDSQVKETRLSQPAGIRRKV